LLIANQGAYDHEYYSLPLLLPASGLLGKLFDRAMERHRALLTVCALAVVALSLYRYASYLREEAGIGAAGYRARRDATAARILEQATTPEEVVISCNATNPTWLYLARRRGWGRSCASETRESLQRLEETGASSMMGRWSDLETPQGSRVARFLRTSQPLAYDDGEWYVAQLHLDETAGGPPWTRAYNLEFAGKQAGPLPEGWRFDSGRWHRGAARLRGRIEGGRLSAVSPPILPPETAGRVAIVFKMRHLRGSGKAQQLTLQSWRLDEATQLAVVLSPRKRRVTLEQTEGGELLDRESMSVPLRVGKAYRLEILYDHLGFQLLLDRKPILSASDHFSSPPAGAIAIRGRNLDVEIERLWVSVRGSSP
jgi:hypothetical protein